MRRVIWLLLAIFPALAWAVSPDISLKDFAGREQNVNQFIGHGKWVAVVVWAHDCRVCDAEIHEMADFHRAHKNRDAIVLGVTIDGEAKRKAAKAFVDRHKLPFVNLIAEPDEQVIQQFGAEQFVGTPTTYLYEPGGRLVAMNIGPVSRQDLENYLERNPPKADSARFGGGGVAQGG